MTILDHIIVNKRLEVEVKKHAFPISILEQGFNFEKEVISMASVLRCSDTGIIAEHKRRSPSKSVINESSPLTMVVSGYESAGASAISILTDTFYFGGSLNDLLLAKETVSIPLLRKEFIIDPYQVYEAKAYGADAILLIAAVLTDQELKSFSQLAKKLQLDVLLEVHNRAELERSLLPTVDMIGVNNRDLNNFEVGLDISKELSRYIPREFVSVSESGINSVVDVQELKTYGFQGFLIGESFMRTENPGESASGFIKALKEI